MAGSWRGKKEKRIAGDRGDCGDQGWNISVIASEAKQSRADAVSPELRRLRMLTMTVFFEPPS
jgi:hypothetical protein